VETPNNNMPEINTAEEIENYISTSNDHQLSNIWTNLQESFDEMDERITCFKGILKKRLRA